MSRFREFDFEHYSFIGSNPEMQKLLRRAYKSKMTCSQFMEEVPKTEWASKGKTWQKSNYRNLHKIANTYEKLDSKFNFFGNYED